MDYVLKQKGSGSVEKFSNRNEKIQYVTRHLDIKPYIIKYEMIYTIILCTSVVDKDIKAFRPRKDLNQDFFDHYGAFELV